MDIRNKEPMFITQDGKEYVVRQGTVGVERKRIIFFYDTTRTVAVGYARDFYNEFSPDKYANLLNDLDAL